MRVTVAVCVSECERKNACRWPEVSVSQPAFGDMSVSTALCSRREADAELAPNRLLTVFVGRYTTEGGVAIAGVGCDASVR